MRARDDAVSTVVGAILLAAIFASAAITVRTTFVPEWRKQSEAETATDAGEDLQRIVTSAAHGSVVPLRLGGGSGLLRSLPGDVAFVPRPAGLTFAAPEALVWQAGPDATTAPAESWRNVTGAPNLTNISALTSLRLRVLAGVAGNHDGDSVNITAYDRDGRVAGSLNLSIVRFPSGFNIHVTVRDPRGVIVYDNPEAYFLQSPIPSFWLDAMRSDLQFRQLVASAPAPVAINISGYHANSGPQNMDLQPQYTAAYLQAVSTFPVQGGTHVLRQPYSLVRPNGALEVGLHPEQFPAQRWIAEGGALGLTQDDGRATRVAPQIGIGRTGSTVAISLRVTTLSGAAASLSSHGAPVLELSPGEGSTAIATMPSLEITMLTRDPAMWADAWRAAAASAGLPPAEHTITQTADTVVVAIRGPSSGGVHDVTLDHQEVNLLVELRTP